MKCQYCHNECKFVELDDLMVKSIEVWKCTHCPHTVRYSRFLDEEKIAMICIGIKLNGHRYAAHFVFEQEGAEEKYTNIVKVIPTRPDDHIDFNVETIFTISGHPSITPSNIQDKLPIYITFS